MSESELSDSGEEPAAALEPALYSRLMHELRHGAAGARLSARLRRALERMSPARRRALVSRTREGCAPLFEAARRGHTEAVEYLVHVCAAPLEQRGVFRAAELADHAAPPLWVAAACGRAGAARALLDAGADARARSDSAGSAVRAACYAAHEDVVRLLCERGADIHAASAAGGTCLIDAVRAPRLVRYLLARGAAVDAADARGETALHHAAREHRADTARLLLAAGADPRLRSRAGDDPLRVAAARAAAPVVEQLLAGAAHEPARAADALELLGASQLAGAGDARAALACWRRATRLRENGGAPKAAAACAALGGAMEWRTRAALAALAAGEAAALRTQALLVAVRVLGETHEDTLTRIMLRGAEYAEAQRYERCVPLWSWALRIRIQRDSLLHADACETLCALTRLVLQQRAGGGAAAGAGEGGGAAAAGEHALDLLELLLGALPEAMRAMEAAEAAEEPGSEAGAGQEGAGAVWERTLCCVTACALAARAGRRLHAALRALAALGPRTPAGDSPLHLACSRRTLAGAAFPSAECARRLLAAGADVHAANRARCTPLHVAAVPYNFSNELVEALLAAGAHLDRPNKFGESALELVPLCRGARVRPLAHVTLACAAARVLAARLPALPRALPDTLRAFVLLHAA